MYPLEGTAYVGLACKVRSCASGRSWWAACAGWAAAQQTQPVGAQWGFPGHTLSPGHGDSLPLGNPRL